MSGNYTQKVLRVVVSSILQAIGWHSANSIPLEIITDILHRYLEELTKQTHRYAEHLGQTEATIEHLELVFKDFGITVPDLEEYIKNVEPIPCPIKVSKYPVPKEDHLNFLKPGSREVVTRPVHVHEHLPAMYPEMEETDYNNKNGQLSVDTNVSSPASPALPSPKSGVFKRPGDPVSLEHPAVKRARLMLEEEGRPLREISSVMMTTSGFLSPAREGKLPEARTPVQPSDSRSNSPQPSSYPVVPPDVKGEKKPKKIPFKKPMDSVKKFEKENKKKEHKLKEAIKTEKPESAEDLTAKKLISMKDLSKLKPLKTGALKIAPSTSSDPSTSSKSVKPSVTSSATDVKFPEVITKMEKPSMQQKIQKPEKSIPFPLPGPQLKIPLVPVDHDFVEGKLPSEPDKHKLNIFRKISKAKEDKSDRLQGLDLATQDSRESSPGLVIDEHEAANKHRDVRTMQVDNVRSAQIDDCIESVIQQGMAISEKESSDVVLKHEDKVQSEIRDIQNSPPNSCMFDDDMSPPGTPSTPKTPEYTLSPQKSEKTSEQKEQKRRKKEKSRLKKEAKIKLLKIPSSFKKTKLEHPDFEITERPRVLHPPMLHKSLPAPVFPFFSHFPPAPGLIPPPISHPLFPRFPLGLGRNLPHPAMPNLPLPPPLFMQPRIDMRHGFRMPPRTEVCPQEVRMPYTEKPSTLVSTAQPLSLHTEKDEKPFLQDAILRDKLLLKKIKGHKKLKKDKDKAKKKKEKRNKLKMKIKAEKKKIKLEKKDKQKMKSKKDKKKDKDHHPVEDEKIETNIPKITLKLGSQSPKPPTPEPVMRKIVIKPVVKKSSPEHVKEFLEPDIVIDSKKREPSPELARISALVTRPPKQRSPKLNLQKHEEASVQPVSLSKSVPSPTVPSTSKTIPFSESAPQHTVIKDIPPFRIDADGNRVWICPACGGHDDGSPMIGCDDCDAWYHWVCVGIQVPPDENEDWYCRQCIVRKQGNMMDKKKRYRKKKVMM